MVSDAAKTTLRVVAAIIVHDGRVLACRRNASKDAGGQWEFPGGKIELGELAVDALGREILEELGVAIRVGALLSIDTTVVSTRNIELHCYWASLVDEAPAASTDHDEFLWLLPTALAALDWAEPDLPAVKIITAGGLPASAEFESAAASAALLDS